MAKITISSISIENFGPFRERQTLDLRVKANRPVILIKALNGSGKTTLLTALQVGLYGYKSLGARRSEYDQMILGLQRKDATGNAVIEVELVIEVSGSRRLLVVRREWVRKSGIVVEELAVFENGCKDVYFSNEWEEYIASILPAELVQLFLFDGEKIEALANPERLPELLQRATEVFLGIGGIDALVNDLKALERRVTLKNKSTSAEFGSARTHIETLQAQAEDLAKKLEVISQKRAAARNATEQAQAILNKFSTDAQRRGLAAYEQAAFIREDVMASKRRSIEARTSLADIISDPVLPVAWLGTLWTQYLEFWEKDQHACHATFLAQEFKKRDSRILSVLKTTTPKTAVEALRKALAADLGQYRAKHPALGASLEDAPPADIERRVSDAQTRLGRQTSETRAAMSALDKAEQRMGQVPAGEQMAEILRILQEYSKATSSAEMRQAELVGQFDETQSQLDHVRMKLNVAQDRLGTEFRDRTLEAKSLESSVRVRQALGVFKEALLASKAQWLSEMITAEFKNLLRKRNLISRVIVDPATYRVSIEDGKRHNLPMDRLSAGERQLLAISVLSALIKERKGRFPVVVDTPLARLDQHHRASLIKRFFATVSHQVVVLSTDQEVDGPAYDALKPVTSAEYTLAFDDIVGRTAVQPLTAKDVA